MKQVIFFKGSTCAPCKAFEPVITEMVANADLPLRVELDNVELMAQFGLRVVPSVVMAHVLPGGALEVEEVLSGAVRSRTLHDALLRFVVAQPD